MSYTYVETATETFTITHARYIASKVGADLKRLQDFYQEPTDLRIANYETELAVLLKYDGLDNVIYGFQRNNLWTDAALQYSARGGVLAGGDDDPGRVPRRIDVSGCTFRSFLTYNTRWFQFSQSDRSAIEKELPFARGSVNEPTIEGGGIWSPDRAYSSAGRGVARSKIVR
jgi:hypothetical protein